MADPERPSDVRAPRPAPPTLKERNAVQRSVDRLLDELAPEKALRRGEPTPLLVEPHQNLFVNCIERGIIQPASKAPKGPPPRKARL